MYLKVASFTTWLLRRVVVVNYLCSFLMLSWERLSRTTWLCASMASPLQCRSIPYLLCWLREI